MAASQGVNLSSVVYSLYHCFGCTAYYTWESVSDHFRCAAFLIQWCQALQRFGCFKHQWAYTVTWWSLQGRPRSWSSAACFSNLFCAYAEAVLSHYFQRKYFSNILYIMFIDCATHTHWKLFSGCFHSASVLVILSMKYRITYKIRNSSHSLLG